MVTDQHSHDKNLLHIMEILCFVCLSVHSIIEPGKSC